MFETHLRPSHLERVKDPRFCVDGSDEAVDHHARLDDHELVDHQLEEWVDDRVGQFRQCLPQLAAGSTHLLAAFDLHCRKSMPLTQQTTTASVVKPF